MTWVFGALPQHAYSVILADPPWKFKTYTAIDGPKAPAQHYPVMTLAQLKALPVARLAAKHCALAMWATAPMLPEALDLMACWGFAFKTMGAWAKMSPTGKGWAFGTGYIYRSASEFYIVGTIGHPMVINRDVRNLICAPTREHSRKPDAMAYNLEQLYPYGRRVELFARALRPKWDVWGNEITKFVAA